VSRVESLPERTGPGGATGEMNTGMEVTFERVSTNGIKLLIEHFRK
jgi:hypothetical protein